MDKEKNELSDAVQPEDGEQEVYQQILDSYNMGTIDQSKPSTKKTERERF
ncbi:hypothetical protein [Alkalicoccobacillus murimartini]|uniref:DUF4025 domain-containing protein n=1 Tax=Alkalicoccobacillus murimartini TaxID=171685 RepID=A0ABT9YJS9_9BACI|nr:hypothetical protein [Alkalicoccobacillus murimartini]MDQ0208116.1 hypothetical protein [Alkalicoccobacillus murimartini]